MAAPALARPSPKPTNFRDPELDIKGRVAEALIEQLFRTMGWKVLRFGMEHTHPHLFESVRGRTDDVSLIVRSQPDFVVQKGDGQPYFVEVKYRADGRLDDRVDNGYPPTTLFVLVSPYRIQCVTYQDLRNGARLSPESRGYYFADRPEFAADISVVRGFLKLAEKFFAFDKTQ